MIIIPALFTISLFIFLLFCVGLRISRGGVLANPQLMCTLPFPPPYLLPELFSVDPLFGEQKGRGVTSIFWTLMSLGGSKNRLARKAQYICIVSLLIR